MEAVIDIRLALAWLGTGWQFGGSVTEGTQAAWNAVDWDDARPKPLWADLCAAHASATQTGLFAALRTTRDARLANTDKMLLPDYPVSANDLASIRTYRSALRELPDAPGAPWDGGGDATPWPVAPAIVQEDQPTAQPCA